MIRPRSSLPVRLGTLAILAFAVLLLPLFVRPALADEEATQTFHIAEISKLLVGYNGDTAIQAVEIKMTAGGQNLVNGMTIATYNGAGVLMATLGTFTASVANGVSGDHILCATAKFQTTFGITPDLIISPFLPVTSGQIAYEKVACRVNVLPYGDVTVPLTSPTVAPPLPAQGAAVLVRTIDNPTTVTCPLNEDAGARFALTTGGPGHAVTFSNNARLSVAVSSNITGVGTPPPASVALRAYPNPVRGVTQIDAPDWQPLSIFDIHGRLVRVLTCAPNGACPQVLGPFHGEWDGTNMQGQPVPSGIYFLRYKGQGGLVVKRLAVTR